MLRKLSKLKWSLACPSSSIYCNYAHFRWQNTWGSLQHQMQSLTAARRWDEPPEVSWAGLHLHRQTKNVYIPRPHILTNPSSSSLWMPTYQPTFSAASGGVLPLPLPPPFFFFAQAPLVRKDLGTEIPWVGRGKLLKQLQFAHNARQSATEREMVEEAGNRYKSHSPCPTAPCLVVCVCVCESMPQSRPVSVHLCVCFGLLQHVNDHKLNLQ